MSALITRVGRLNRYTTLQNGFCPRLLRNGSHSSKIPSKMVVITGDRDRTIYGGPADGSFKQQQTPPEVVVFQWVNTEERSWSLFFVGRWSSALYADDLKYLGVRCHKLNTIPHSKKQRRTQEREGVGDIHKGITKVSCSSTTGTANPLKNHYKNPHRVPS